MAEIVYTPLHIDVARYASDDFNPFHDKHKWQDIAGNPFGGPIALGFQLGAFIVETVREAWRRAALVHDYHRYSTVQLRFVDAVRAGDPLAVEVKPARAALDGDGVASRFVLRRHGRAAVLGSLRAETRMPGEDDAIDDLRFALALDGLPDRHVVPGGAWFLKRKFMLTSNAKNFLSAAGVDAFRYFDELADRVQFPELYPASLISSALLERGIHRRHDFVREPMIYAQHLITTDREVLARLRSNDRLNLVVSEEPAGQPRMVHRCRAYTARGERLFTAEITLVSLASLAQAAVDEV
ncbi:MAG TPA: MaoC/PaaZ C-terminal domain-containing protein [Gammaproteobacteria bacterium]|nr:MaoC/PaaZ C-terminal domain-containing protein [Gammaproteobacteria bacterium]